MHAAFLADHPELVPTLAQWLVAEWGDPEGEDGYEAYLRSTSERASRHHLPATLVGTVNGKLVATATLKWREIDFSPRANYWLGSLFVAEDERGKGYGETILRFAESVASEAGYTPLYLYTRSKIDYFRELDWDEVAETAVRGEPYCVMQKAV